MKTKNYDDYYFRNLTAESAYIIGLLTADGWITEPYSVSLYLEETDKEIVKRVRDCLGVPPNKKLARSVKKNGTVMRGFTITNPTWIGDLAEYSIVRRKSRKTFCPQKITMEYFYHYLRGLIDGDGHIGENNKTGSVVLKLRGSKRLLEDINRVILNDLGANRSVDLDGGTYKIVWYSGCLDILDKVYDHASLYMKRKYDKYVDISNAQEFTTSHRGRLKRLSLLAEDKKKEYINKLHMFVEKYGTTPTAYDVVNRKRKLQRGHDGFAFSMATIYKYFGNFNGFISQAGYNTRPVGDCRQKMKI